MARIQQKIVTCDICGSRENVLRVRLLAGTASATGDVCAKHRRQVDSLISTLGATRPRGIAAIPVMSMEEVAEVAARTKRSQSARKGTQKPASGPNAVVDGPTLPEEDASPQKEAD